MKKLIYALQPIIILFFVAFATMASANIDDTLFVLGQKKLSSGKIVVGYATAPNDDNGTQAVRPYAEQKSFPTLDLQSYWARESSHLRIDSLVNGKNDYIAELHYDHKGRFRLALLDESLLHRLDHQPLPPPSSQITTVDTDLPDEQYDLKFRQQDVELRYAPVFLPSHLSLRYHRTAKNGENQLRYLDENCTNQCHIVSRSRAVDQETQEILLLADAHLGAVEVGIDHLHRSHDNHSPVMTDSFGTGAAQHDHLPGNQYHLTTLRAHNSLAGGLVVAGTLSAGKRKNETEQSDVTPIHAETDIFRAAGDLTWTPSPMVTVSFRYRITQIDNDVSSLYLTPALQVPEAVDLSRNVYGAAVVYVPTRRLTIKGDYQHDQIRRDHTALNSFWEVPKNEDLDKLSMDLHYRPFIKSTTRFDLGYNYSHSSDPAYAMSNQITHVVKANARINPSNDWGLSLNLRGEKGENGGVTAPVSTGQALFDRVSQKGDASINTWFMPVKRLTLGTTLGASHLLIKQDLRFGRYSGPVDVVASDVETRQIVRTAAVNLNLAVTRELSCNTEFHHVRGSYHYAPDFPDLMVGTLTLDASGLSAIESVELSQKGFSAGFNWQLQERLNFGISYFYDSYHDVKNDRLDSTVQSYHFTVAKTW